MNQSDELYWKYLKFLNDEPADFDSEVSQTVDYFWQGLYSEEEYLKKINQLKQKYGE